MELAVFEERVEALEAEVAEVMGVINAAHGRLVDLVGEALDEDLWKVWGIHSPGHWLAWQAGMSTARASAIAKVAERRTELPSAVAALRAGEVSVDAAIEVARRAPASYEESITTFARTATITQLRRCLRDYAYDDETDEAKPKPREDTRSVSMGTDDKGWWLKGRLPVDEGAVVEQAIRAARDDLYRHERADTADGEQVRDVSLADGLLAVGEASLAGGQARFPGTGRYQVHLHLEASPDRSDPGVLALHLGPALPAALRALLLCDTDVRPVFHGHRLGEAVSVGRRTRVVSARLRRVVEHRDGGCRVPGCGRTAGLEIHHIVHWENGGPTDTANLVALCRFHHRLHHQGLLGIAGDADSQGPTGLVCTDRWGRRLDPAGQPVTPHHNTPGEAAAGLGLERGNYRHPLGERLDAWSVTFNPNRPPPDPSRPPDPSGPRGQNSPGGESADRRSTAGGGGSGGGPGNAPPSGPGPPRPAESTDPDRSCNSNGDRGGPDDSDPPDLCTG